MIVFLTMIAQALGLIHQNEDTGRLACAYCVQGVKHLHPSDRYIWEAK